MTEGLTLFKALRYAGFDHSGTREIRRGNVVVSLRIGYRSHWKVSTPYGLLDYNGQAQALHGLVLYRLINKQDLEKMIELGYEPAKKELADFEKTMARNAKLISSEDLRGKEREEIERQERELQKLQYEKESKRKLREAVLELLKTCSPHKAYCSICDRSLSSYEGLLSHLGMAHPLEYQRLFMQAKKNSMEKLG